jgi:shikimate kinase
MPVSVHFGHWDFEFVLDFVFRISSLTNRLYAANVERSFHFKFPVMVITLIGYRGSGKSTVAAPLAEQLGWDWIDADAELEQRAGRSIREIFETDGEPAFRELERLVLTDLLSGHRLVVAAGGGAVLNADTRRQMQSAGPVVWLQARVETLAQRIAADTTTAQRRPNLTSGGGRDEIEKVLAMREQFYRECATLIVPVDDRPIGELVVEIMAGLRAEVGKAESGERRHDAL